MKCDEKPLFRSTRNLARFIIFVVTVTAVSSPAMAATTKSQGSRHRSLNLLSHTSDSRHHFRFARLASGIEITYRPTNPPNPRSAIADARVLRKRLLVLGLPFQIAVVGNSDVISLPSTSTSRNVLANIGASGRIFLRPVLCRVPIYSKVAPTSGDDSSATCSVPAISGVAPPLDVKGESIPSVAPSLDLSKQDESVIEPQLQEDDEVSSRLLLGPTVVTNAGVTNSDAVGPILQLRLSSSAISALSSRDENRQVAIDADGVVLGVFSVQRNARIIDVTFASAFDATNTSREINSGPIPVPLLPLSSTTFRSEWYGPDLTMPNNHVPGGISMAAISNTADWPAMATNLFSSLRKSGAQNIEVSKLGSDEIEAIVFGSASRNKIQIDEMIGDFAKATGISSTKDIFTAKSTFE